MFHDVSFTFNEPEWVIPTYGFILLGLAFSAWKIWRIRAMAGSVRAFLFSRQGFPYLLIILLGLFWLYFVIVRSYSSFWTMHLADAKRLTLDYWFPRRDYTMQPQDIREFTLITNQRRSKGEVTNQYWLISLVTRAGVKHTSIDIHSEAKAKRAIWIAHR